MEKVKVWLEISGWNCHFKEAYFKVLFDITNNINYSEHSLEEIQNHVYDEYYDFAIKDAVKIEDKYYINL